MAIDLYDFLEGLDPSVLSTISGSQLLQMIRNATPSASRGLIICDNATPDTTTYPRYKRYKWIKPSENNAITRHWDESVSDWVEDSVPNDSIDTDKLQDESVTLPKLYNPNDITKAGFLIRVNAAGTGFELWELQFANNSIDIQAIGLGTTNEFPHVNAGGTAWEFLSADEIANLFSSGSIDASVLATSGSAGSLIYYNGSLLRFVPLAPGSNGDVLTVVAGLPAWSTPSAAILSSESTSTLQNVPAAAGVVTYAHGLAQVPKLVTITMVCISADGSYSVNDELPISCFNLESGGAIDYPVGVRMDSTNIKIIFSADTLFAIKSDGSTYFNADRSKWQIRIKAFK